MDFSGYVAVFNTVAGGGKHKFIVCISACITVEVKHFEIFNGIDIFGMDGNPVHTSLFTAFHDHYVGIFQAEAGVAGIEAVVEGRTQQSIAVPFVMGAFDGFLRVFTDIQMIKCAVGEFYFCDRTDMNGGRIQGVGAAEKCGSKK